MGPRFCGSRGRISFFSSRARNSRLPNDRPVLLCCRISLTSLAQAGPVVLQLLDVTGRRKATLETGVQAAGQHSAGFSAGALAKGVYFLRLAAGGRVVTRCVVRD